MQVQQGVKHFELKDTGLKIGGRTVASGELKLTGATKS